MAFGNNKIGKCLNLHFYISDPTVVNPRFTFLVSHAKNAPKSNITPWRVYMVAKKYAWLSE